MKTLHASLSSAPQFAYSLCVIPHPPALPSFLAPNVGQEVDLKNICRFGDVELTAILVVVVVHTDLRLEMNMQSCTKSITIVLVYLFPATIVIGRQYKLLINLPLIK